MSHSNRKCPPTCYPTHFLFQVSYTGVVWEIQIPHLHVFYVRSVILGLCGKYNFLSAHFFLGQLYWGWLGNTISQLQPYTFSSWDSPSVLFYFRPVILGLFGKYNFQSALFLFQGSYTGVVWEIRFPIGNSTSFLVGVFSFYMGYFRNKFSFYIPHKGILVLGLWRVHTDRRLHFLIEWDILLP